MSAAVVYKGYVENKKGIQMLTFLPVKKQLTRLQRKLLHMST